MPTQLARFDPQLILLDIMLLGMDGLEVLRTRHILRLQQGSCSIETGFVWNIEANMTLINYSLYIFCSPSV